MKKKGTRIRTTMYDTPIIKSVMKIVARLYLKIIGWEQVDNRKGEKRFIAVFVPHTSAWDFVNLLMLALALDVRSYWLGKHTLFKRPFGCFFRYVAGLPIDRSKNANTVDQIISYFNKIDDMALTLAPEGTRRPVEKWKTGFYHMAVGAGVPIALVHLDYKRKNGGIMEVYYPTGDKDHDIKKIRERFKDVKGKHPERYIP